MQRSILPPRNEETTQLRKYSEMCWLLRTLKTYDTLAQKLSLLWFKRPFVMLLYGEEFKAQHYASSIIEERVFINDVIHMFAFDKQYKNKLNANIKKETKLLKRRCLMHMR